MYTHEEFVTDFEGETSVKNPSAGITGEYLDACLSKGGKNHILVLIALLFLGHLRR
jgi:hypothetical protein